jgi:hypothetical protein
MNDSDDHKGDAADWHHSPPAPPVDIHRNHTHCTRCGLRLERDSIQTGFDAKTGEPVFTKWKACPKWHSSWTNLWMGGSSHDCVRDDENRIGV